MSALPPPDKKAAHVRRMFDRLAPSYDRTNRIMTLGADQRWRNALVDRLDVGPGDFVLDLACGTGDFARLCQGRGAQVLGLDFARGMLIAAHERAPGLPWVQADALLLPFRSASFDVAVSGFALRNFSALPPVFEELARVIRPGGRLGLLEVDRPGHPLIRAGHAVYFDRVVPLLGGLIGGEAESRAAYRYLPQSAVYLPPERELVRMLVTAGFHRIAKRRPMLGAIQAITGYRRNEEGG